MAKTSVQNLGPRNFLVAPSLVFTKLNNDSSNNYNTFCSIRICSSGYNRSSINFIQCASFITIIKFILTLT